MTGGWRHVSLDGTETDPEKPGERWELSSALGVDAFTLNVAILEPEDRLSQNHLHYHENQQELFYVVSGRCRVETPEGGFEMGVDEAVAHVIHNPFDEPCKLVAIGWPPEGRYPAHQREETADVYDGGRTTNDP